MKAIVFILFFAINGPLLASDLGKEAYEITCKTCHSPQFATGMHAPAAFNKKAWAIRFKNAEIEAEKNPTEFKTAMDYLLYKASIGKGLMPHGGLCKEADVPRKDCSDKAIADAIYYMAGITAGH
ncbi:c-type cytochrome [Legionella fallonii]|uniref:Cytochrome c domain-containing protein n=1 Tax=Legionella fallonii LLAP-10 TaxID=1212491 RepID=A0A098G8P9_9GAMM|nr:c-type cytochrome [Legionella fallonii]CEG58369.1 conserved exported protein of unknown function [Legionella fallonii LLAP-10]